MSNNYKWLGGIPDAQFAAGRLKAIRQRLQKDIGPGRDGKLLLATWNLRDFDSDKFGWGHREKQSMYYIAEIIAAFDLVALQEIGEDLDPFIDLMGILGKDWDFIVTDVTEGQPGNGERMAFVFRTSRVWFRHIAGEVVLPQGQLIVPAAKVKSPKAQEVAPTAPVAPVKGTVQFARTPFLVSFQAGWFKFSLCTVHIYYGKASGPQLTQRIEEIRTLVDFFAARQDQESTYQRDKAIKEAGKTVKKLAAAKAATYGDNYILLGDFNVVSPKHKTMEALARKDFVVPEPIDGTKLTAEQRKHFYDQIAVRLAARGEGDQGAPKFTVERGGVVNVFADVFTDSKEDRARYAALVPEDDTEPNEQFRAKTAEERYEKWRTWQMSDHDPLWIEIAIDYTDDYLERIVNPPV